MSNAGNQSQKARLAVDIGGTFTDVVLQLASGRQLTTKVLTTQGKPGDAVMQGISQVLGDGGLQPADVGLVLHGTTLATNALIERRGAVTALLTTEGHRDALEMAHEDRFEQYDINIVRPRPLVPRHLRLGISERLDRDGNVLVPLDEASVTATLRALDQYEVTSVAIGYLHAYVNPQHEQRTAEILVAARPQISLTLASEVCPEIREYERLSTACANAYVRPLMTSYLDRLAEQLRHAGLNCPFLLMTSGGGLTTVETASRFPIRLVESGPAGGAILARHIAREKGLKRMISFDMGGTTAKLCLVDDYAPLASRSFEIDRVYRFRKGSGLPVRIPVIEMVEIGAGGGSIARVDRLGRIKVGPDSAGSEPGPAAYGQGGKQPAVTDADLQLGRLVARWFAGGSIALDAPASRRALDAAVGHPLQLATDGAALGISEVVDENMAAAARAHAAEFGLHLAQREMIAFGGAAPMHAARLGEKLGLERIIIPAGAGVGSAVGFLLAPIAYEVVRSRYQLLSQLDPGLVNHLMAEMSDEATTVVRQGTSGALTQQRHAYMRYSGQGHEIAVSLPVANYEAAHVDGIRRAFEQAYERLYGRIIAGVEIEILSWTLTVSGPPPAVAQSAAGETPAARPAPASARQSLLDPASGVRDAVDVYLREDLAPGCCIPGPALIAESQTTTVVTRRYDATIDPRGHIVLTGKSHD